MTKLVLIAGFQGSPELYAPLSACLPEGWELQVLDYPSAPMGYDALEKWAMTQLPEPPFTLIGESFGGPLAIRLAAKGYGEKLVLVASFLRTPIAPLIASIARFFAPVFQRAPSAVFRSRMKWLGADEDLTKALEKIRFDIDKDVFAARLRAVLSVDVRAEYAGLAQEILLIHGIADPLIPQSRLKEMARNEGRLQQCYLKCGHFILQMAPKDCAAAIKAFVTAEQTTRD